jgi:hypothetical protein
MTPEQASARAALLLISRLVRNHGLNADEAVTTVAQRRRRETGPHTHLVIVEANAVLAEAFAPMRKLIEGLQPIAQAAAAAMADLLRALQPVAQQAAAARRDRPAWASTYGPPPRRQSRKGTEAALARRAGCHIRTAQQWTPQPRDRRKPGHQPAVNHLKTVTRSWSSDLGFRLAPE